VKKTICYRSLLAVFFLGIGFARLVAVVLESDSLSYVDQGDGARTTSCLSLRTTVTLLDARKLEGDRAPPHLLIPDSNASAQCVWSSAVVVISLAQLFSRVWLGSGDYVDLRFVAAIYSILLFVVACAIHFGLKSNERARVFAAFAFAFLISDPVNTLYLGTALTEPAALVSAYGLVASLTLFNRTRGVALASFALSGAALTYSRTAHFALPLLFAFAIFFLVQRHERRWGAAALAIAVVIASSAISYHVTHDRFALVNRTNSILAASAPLSHDPNKFLASLGLPKECAELVGVSWYLNYGHDIAKRCPGVADVSVMRLASALASDPMLLVKINFKSILFVGNAKQDYLLRTQDAQTLSLFDWIRYAPFWVRAAAIIFLIVAVGYGLTRTKDTRIRIASILSGAVAASVWNISLLGDGFSELARHAHLSFVAIGALAIIFIYGITRADLSRLAIIFPATLGVAFVVTLKFPVSEIAPMSLEGHTGLLVVSSIPPTNVSVAPGDFVNTNRAVLVPTNTIARVLAVPTSGIRWVAVQIPQTTEQCIPLHVVIEFEAAKTTSPRICARSLKS
jgi:hypothetical protein